MVAGAFEYPAYTAHRYASRSWYRAGAEYRVRAGSLRHAPKTAHDPGQASRASRVPAAEPAFSTPIAGYGRLPTGEPWALWQSRGHASLALSGLAVQHRSVDPRRARHCRPLGTS